MKISIIIPIYQVEKYIKRCLLSVIEQNSKDYEIIIVNDATKDASFVLAKQILKNATVPVVFLEHDTNKGLSASRNTGIRAAQGEYLLFLDSDDALAPNAVTTFIQWIEKNNADCIVGNYKVITDEDEYVSLKYAVEKFYDTSCGIRKAYAQGDIPIPAWNKCIKRSVLLEKQLYFKEGILHEDELWTFLLVNELQTLYTGGSCTYLYFVRSGSIMTGAKAELKLTSGITIYQEMVNYVLMNKVSDERIKVSLDTFVFHRYLDLFNSKSIDVSTKKSLYNQLRFCQNKVIGSRNKKGFIIRFHLFFPKVFGYALMNLITTIYSKKKR